MGLHRQRPGESKHADIVFRFLEPGNAGRTVFIDGQKALTLRGPEMPRTFQLLVADYIEKRFGHGQAAAE